MSYAPPCYWEQGYCETDLPCQVFEADSLMRGLVFDRTVPDAPLTKTRVAATAAHIRRDTGRLYIANAGEIMQWDGDDVNRLPFEWMSKTFVTSRPVNFGFAQVILDDISSEFAASLLAIATANSVLWATGGEKVTAAMNEAEANQYEVNGSALTTSPTLDTEYSTLYVYADGILRIVINVLSEKLYRLPAGFLATRWEVEVAGNKGVRRITLATSAAEIAAQ